MKTSDQGKRQIRGHTLPPLENNSRNKNNEVRSSLFYTFVVLLFLLPILLNAQCFLIQKSCLLCLYIIKQKQVMAQYSTNQDRARQSVELAEYIIIPRVRKAEQQTEIQSKVSDLATGPRDQFNTHSHTVFLGGIRRWYQSIKTLTTQHIFCDRSFNLFWKPKRSNIRFVVLLCFL